MNISLVVAAKGARATSKHTLSPHTPSSEPGHTLSPDPGRMLSPNPGHTLSPNPGHTLSPDPGDSLNLSYLSTINKQTYLGKDGSLGLGVPAICSSADGLKL